ncbi:MAG: Ig domain-containing protein [Candidatus Dormibacteraeota bacterium]|nr:Ig domain-containing protein [Candidatus Dormibacteraeota bacterium]
MAAAAPAVKPLTPHPGHGEAHSRKHSEAEGVALLVIGGGAIGFGIWELLHGSGPPAATTVTVTTTSIPGMVVGTPYAKQLAASGGTSPYTWQVVAGTLPTGIALSAAGTLSGTPTTAGPYTFTVQATDANGDYGQEQYQITVQAGSQAGCTMTPGTLIQPSGSAAIYVVNSDGSISLITSKAVFDACGYAANAVQPVGSIAGCPIGAPVTGPPCPSGPQGQGYPGPNCPMGPGLLAKMAGNPAVWYADCGTGPGGSGCEKHLVTGSAFYGPCGWSSQRLYPVSQAILDATPTGAPITDCTQVSLYSCGGGGGPGEMPTRPGYGAGRPVGRYRRRR